MPDAPATSRARRPDRGRRLTAAPGRPARTPAAAPRRSPCRPRPAPPSPSSNRRPRPGRATTAPDAAGWRRVRSSPARADRPHRRGDPAAALDQPGQGVRMGGLLTEPKDLVAAVIVRRPGRQQAQPVGDRRQLGALGRRSGPDGRPRGRRGRSRPVARCRRTSARGTHPRPRGWAMTLTPPAAVIIAMAVGRSVSAFGHVVRSAPGQVGRRTPRRPRPPRRRRPAPGRCAGARSAPRRRSPSPARRRSVFRRPPSSRRSRIPRCSRSCRSRVCSATIAGCSGSNR